MAFVLEQQNQIVSRGKVIISGATSFIGIALIKLLQKEGYSVVAIIRPNSSRKSIIQSLDGVILVEEELSSLQDPRILEACKDSQYFFHLGWSSDFEDPRYNLKGQLLNVGYLLDAIHIAAKSGCEAFIGVGSQAECGVLSTRLSERTEENPLTAYAKAKCLSYAEGKRTCEELGMRFCWPRLLSAYGVYDRPHTLIMSCMRACADRTSIDFTACEQIWDYIYVDDVAGALLAIAQHGIHGVKYPIASGNGKILSEYIRIISDLMNAPHIMDGIGKKEYAVGQPMYLVGDIERLNHDTGFNPQVDFIHGISKMIEFQNNTVLTGR